MSVLRDIARTPDSIRQALASARSKVAFAAISLATVALYVYLPVRLIPGNDLAFQLSIMTARGWLLVGALSVLNALLIVMQAHIFIRGREVRKTAAMVGASGVGSVSAVFASMLGTASCSACVAGVLGFLGAGSVLFVLNHRDAFIAAAMSIVSVAVVLASRRIQNHCARCSVSARSC